MPRGKHLRYLRSTSDIFLKVFTKRVCGRRRHRTGLFTSCALRNVSSLITGRPRFYRLRLRRLFAVKILNTMKNQLLFYYRPIGDIIIIIFHNQTSMITISGAICLIPSNCSSITLFLYSSIASFAPADTRERETFRPSTSA